jgi:hypothetical protein
MRDQATTIIINIHHVMGEPSQSRIVGAIFVCAPSRRNIFARGQSLELGNSNCQSLHHCDRWELSEERRRRALEREGKCGSRGNAAKRQNGPGRDEIQGSDKANEQNGEDGLPRATIRAMLRRCEEQCCVGLPHGAAFKSTWNSDCGVCSRALMSNKEFEDGICISRCNLDACLCARKGSDCHGGDRQPDPCVPVSGCRHRQILSLIVPYLPICRLCT